MTAGTAPASGDALTEAFEAQRPRLVRVAYATVGSVAEAEDCVQEAWLRCAASRIRPGSATSVRG
jgi:DNA-directed RNA polymerase specialized sigma24 family protein